MTIPVLQSGPDGNGTAFLQAAKAAGARIDLVNIMTMDYGGAVADMGAAAISATKATLSVAQGVWPSYSYANIGITPMIGQNDQSGEIFTAADARNVVSFASANGVGRLAFWSIGRDQACAGGAGGGASPNCSSIAQNSLDFTSIFNGAASGNGGTGGTGNPAPTSGASSPAPTATGGTSGCTAPAWNSATAYTGGAQVSFNGHKYTAKWWTQGEQPDQNLGDGKPWADNGACAAGGSGGGAAGGTSAPTSATAAPSTTASGTSSGQYPAWQANHAYAVAALVSYNGHNYRCIQAHTSLTGWEPPNVPALWQALS